MNKIYETENLFLKELDKSSARQVLDYYMRNKAFLEEWEIIRNEEFYTLDYQEKMLEEEARYIENKNLVKLWLFKKDDEEKILPTFEKGESGPHKPDLAEKWTQPPKPYTEATLLRAMETAGKMA